jgi:HlyD family secretion protein
MQIMNARMTTATNDDLEPNAAGTAEKPPSMDRKMARTRRINRPIVMIAAAVAIIGALTVTTGFSLEKSYRIDINSLGITTTRRGIFEDYVPLRASIAPQNTVFLDATEGGKVEKVHVENGVELKMGDLIVSLSNSALQLSVTNAEAQVAEQLNNMRTLELTLEQNRLNNRRATVELEYREITLTQLVDRLRKVAEGGYVSKQEFQDKENELAHVRNLLALAREAESTDAHMQQQQLAAQKITSERLEQNLEIARKNLDDLNIRAPVDGKLSGFEAVTGQNIERGKRLGQLDELGGFKLQALIDEYYLDRVDVGQQVSYEHDGSTFTAQVTKVFPQVTNGQFQVDIMFEGEQPTDLRRGQTLQTRLTLGDSSPALLISAGAFHQSTGGNWIYVLDAEGKQAVRREVRLGRKNADTVEVLQGLAEGDKVIVSSYEGYPDDVVRLKLSDD